MSKELHISFDYSAIGENLGYDVEQEVKNFIQGFNPSPYNPTARPTGYYGGFRFKLGASQLFGTGALLKIWEVRQYVTIQKNTLDGAYAVVLTKSQLKKLEYKKTVYFEDENDPQLQTFTYNTIASTDGKKFLYIYKESELSLSEFMGLVEYKKKNGKQLFDKEKNPLTENLYSNSRGRLRSKLLEFFPASEEIVDNF